MIKKIGRKLVIGLILFLILIAYHVTSSIDSLINLDNDNNEIKLAVNHYENMIYKGGILPLPFPEDGYVITSKFNPNRRHPLTGIVRPHNGLDIVSYNKESEILAVADGVVSVSSYQHGGAGNYVTIEHENGMVTRYMHLRDTPSVKKGDKVTAGTVIGIQGATGGVTGIHLHFELWINGGAVDAEPYLFGGVG